jgi:Domain of unknown function (DUF4160)
MPTIVIFYGIVIQMFHRDHGPPHVHAKYHGAEAQVRIADGEIHRGALPPTARRLVKRWVLRYKPQLVDNWQKGQALEPFERIPGLEE